MKLKKSLSPHVIWFADKTNFSELALGIKQVMYK